MFTSLKAYLLERHGTRASAREFLKYLGPGLLITVGFIDPGNWAANIAAGSEFGYSLLWVITLSTFMLILLQHNAAHLGIVTGDCISESATRHLRPWASRLILLTAVGAAIATALAEILGAAIALNMLFRIPLVPGALLTVATVSTVLATNTYPKVEKWIVGFVSLIGISFLYELLLLDIQWDAALIGLVNPVIPTGSIPILMSVLGAVVMPHNLFLHSEIIQSRQWNLADRAVMRRQLDYEFLDTLFSMLIGWVINSAIIILAVATFHAKGTVVTDLPQAGAMLKPLLGPLAATVFACALLFSGLASSITAGMAGGSIFAGMFGETYDIKDRHTRLGLGITYGAAAVTILFISNPFKGLIGSQVLLSVQLPITVFLLLFLTSSKKVMGAYANKTGAKLLLFTVAGIISLLNILLFVDMARQNFRDPRAHLSQPAPIPCSKRPGPPRETGTPVMELTDDNAQRMTGMEDYVNVRWLDINDNSYSRDFIASFRYANTGSGGPLVRIRIEPSAETLCGRLEARRLKPNFAYQIKLRGIPSDRRSFDAIGYAGRWRLPGPGTNYSDEDYENAPDQAAVEAYLLFDYFITDREGNAARNFALDSSLHVLWREDQRPNEAPLEDMAVAVVDASDPATYMNPLDRHDIQRVFAEREMSRYRSADQVTRLPPGDYRAELVLTEESFHANTMDGGFWATVYRCPISFTIPAPANHNKADDRQKVGVR
jgi:manganese transport protein